MAYFKSSIVSVILHVAVIGGFLGFATIKGCMYKPPPVEIKEFTIAVEPYEEEPAPEPPKEEPKVKEPDPPKPDDIALPDKKQPPKKDPPKKDPPKKDPPKKDPPKKDPPKKDPPKIEKGKRINKPPVVSNVKPKTKQTLSDEEIKKWLGKRVKVGEETVLPANDMSLYTSMLVKEIESAWDVPPENSCGSGSAVVLMSLGPGGRLANARITRSSGSAAFDNSLLQAIRRVGSIPDLSAEFIKANSEICIQFEKGKH